MLSGLGAWLAGEGLGLVLGFLAAFLRDLIGNMIAADQQRELGRKEAEADGLKAQAEGLRQATQAANEAAERHKADPTDAAFDQRFKRDD